MNTRQCLGEIEELRKCLLGGLERLRALELLLNPDSSHPATSTSERTILIADDDPIQCKVLSRMLSAMGYESRVVHTGQEVLAELENQLYPVVLLDVQMPELDGLETARRIRYRFSPSPYLIALTAGSSSADRRSVMEAGMQDYLAKPLRREELRDALSQAFLGEAGESA